MESEKKDEAEEDGAQTKKRARGKRKISQQLDLHRRSRMEGEKREQKLTRCWRKR